MEDLSIDLSNSVQDLRSELTSIIRVIGVGGAGGSAVKNMIEIGIKDVNYIIANTDKQALDQNPAPIKVQLGPSITKGLGCGCVPEKGRECAIESIEEIKAVLQGAEMVFVTAGMGGGTGTGAAPVIAKTAKDLGILTIGIVSIPYLREQNKKIKVAIEGVKEMEASSDAVLVVNNERLHEIYGDLPHRKALKCADGVLATATKSLAEIITVYGDSNVDFADVSSALKDSGVALIGTGTANGEDRAIEAVKKAIESPLLNNNDIRGSHWVLVNIFSSEEHEMLESEFDRIMDYVSSIAGGNEENFAVKYGTGIDDSLGEDLRVTIVAAGFSNSIFDMPQENPQLVVDINQAEEEESARKIDLTDDNDIAEDSTDGLIKQLYNNDSALKLKEEEYDIRRLMSPQVVPFEQLKASLPEIEGVPAFMRRTAK